jgi:L-glyceraldehyde 3-phosphate reductase
MFERAPEAGLLDVLKEKGVGCIPFSPLAGGQLTNRYLHGIPQDSRAASGSQFLNPDQLTEEKRLKVVALNALAESRGQKLSQMALAWVLRHDAVTSVLIGASKTSQIDDAVGMLENRQFSAQELATIDDILNRSN